METGFIKVSVIIPIYNRERYLEECLSSILSQSLNEIEIICINDGSTDGTRQLLKKYEQDPRIVIIDQSNQGAGISRNNGMQIAKGKYIFFMDSDDYLPQNYVLEKLYNTAERENALICGGNLNTTTGEFGDIIYGAEQFWDYQNVQAIYSFQRYLYQSEFLRMNAICFPPYGRFEDPPFLVKAMMAAGRFYTVNMVVYKYRDRYKTVTYSEAVIADILKGIRDVLLLTKKNNLIIAYDKVMSIYKSFIPYIYAYVYLNSTDVYEINEEICGILKEELSITCDVMTKKEQIIEYGQNCVNELLELPLKEKVIVYGAGILGKRLVGYFERKNIPIVGVAVSDTKENLGTLGKYTVRRIDAYLDEREEALIYVALGKKYRDEVKEHLKELGFINAYDIDSRKMTFVDIYLKSESRLQN